MEFKDIVGRKPLMGFPVAAQKLARPDPANLYEAGNTAPPIDRSLKEPA